MTQVAKLDIPGDTFNISGRENKKGNTQGDDDTEALLMDGESHGNDDKSSNVAQPEGIQSQTVGAEEEEDGENKSVFENDARQDDVNPTSHITDETEALLPNGESLGNDDKDSDVVEPEGTQSQTTLRVKEDEDGENESASKNGEREDDVNPTSNNTDDTAALLEEAEETQCQNVGKEMSEREAGEEEESVNVKNEDQEHDLKPASVNEETHPAPDTSSIPATSDDSFSD